MLESRIGTLVFINDLLESDEMLNSFVLGELYRIDIAIVIKVNQADHNPPDEKLCIDIHTVAKFYIK